MTKFKAVKTKTDFVKRYISGEFGNRSPTWNHLNDFIATSHTTTDRFHLRTRRASGDTWYDIKAWRMLEYWQLALKKGYRPEELYISQMAPTLNTTLQGELMQTEDGLMLRGTYVRLPMRKALKLSSFVVTSLRAVCQLKTYCDPVSVDWMNELIERYPGHVIEFSTYNVTFGTIPRLNTIIWEVRDY